jgi:hypothetical protein
MVELFLLVSAQSSSAVVFLRGSFTSRWKGFRALGWLDDHEQILGKTKRHYSAEL